MRIGLIGYGTGGQHFHAPFIEAAEGCELAGVVARAPETRAKVEADFPGLPIHSSLSEIIAAGGIDAVTITTPPQTRRDLVLEAIAAGLHVVADKPFAPDAEGGRMLARAARDRGVTLGVFHNRRWDADLRTLKKLIDDGRLGEVWRIHSRMDQDGAHTLEAGPTGGLLRDLGSHVVDQMLFLLGPAVEVDAQMDVVDLPEGPTDAGFTIALRHAGGAHSHLEASKLNRVDARDLRAYGSGGFYGSSTTDVQAQAIFAGQRPADDPAGWGFEPKANWGTLHTEVGAVRVPSEQGRYHDYYAAFARAVADGTAPPVTAEDGIRTLAVLDAARQSATEGRSIKIEGNG